MFPVTVPFPLSLRTSSFFSGHLPDGSGCDVVLCLGSEAAKPDETGSKRPLSPACQVLIKMDGEDHITRST